MGLEAVQARSAGILPQVWASAGTWLACFESTGIKDSCGVVQSKWAAPRETLGQGQAILDFYARQGGGYPMGVGQLSESDAVDALRIPFYSSRHPGSHMFRDLSRQETLELAAVALQRYQKHFLRA